MYFFLTNYVTYIVKKKKMENSMTYSKKSRCLSNLIEPINKPI